MGEIPAVGVGAATEPATRKHKTGLDVDGVEEEPLPGAASGYTIPKKKKKKKKKKETAAKPSDRDPDPAGAWNGRPERGPEPVVFERGMTFLTAKALGFVMATVPTEEYTAVIFGLEVRATTLTVAV